MSIIQNLNDVSKQLFSKNNDNLLFHKHRSGRLLKRVVLVVRAIKVSENTKDPKILQVADLLATTLEEIRDYMTLFSTKNTVLAKHVVIYGSDEEQFIKWGERLQHCVDTFGESASFIGVFDEEIDVQDFQKDLVFLKSRMNEILALLVEDAESKGSNVSPVDLIKTMESLIGHQANVRSTYKTKTAPTEALEIDPKKIKYEMIIGQGGNSPVILGFGVVWSARYKGENVAIKTIPSQTLTKQSVADLKSEANIMRRLAHPRIVSCFGMFEHEGNQCVVMELMESGSLQDYIHEHQCPEGWLMREAIALDICSGMSYLHRLNVIHRDLKPGNVVLNGYLQAKITDFGLSVVKNTAVTSIKGSEMGTVQYMVTLDCLLCRLLNVLVYHLNFLQNRTFFLLPSFCGNWPIGNLLTRFILKLIIECTSE